MRESIAVIYLARGIDQNHLKSIQRFRESYQRFNAGREHRLYLLFKGFKNPETLDAVQQSFAGIAHESLFYEEDSSFDIGAYAWAAKKITEDHLCFFNTHSEIMASAWLEKFARNGIREGVGLVGATGSYESLHPLDPLFPKFPNVHIRTNAFLIRREFFVESTESLHIQNKKDAWMFESGPQSMTQRVLEKGLGIFIVGKNGRGYAPPSWPVSKIFLDGIQENLLVHDNHTRRFENLRWSQKDVCRRNAWGTFRNAEIHGKTL
ncbi:MAG: hypothetical protein V1746_02000 [bacterium]